jgi:hypothetical protein
MDSLRLLILITPAYSYYALYYSPVVMNMFTYYRILGVIMQLYESEK